MLELSTFLVLFFLAETLYFRISRRFNIDDKPNHRSSHQNATIRGGGILFPIAGLLSVVIYEPREWIYASALLVLAVVSFWDDLSTISSRIRMVAHTFSVCVFLYSLHLPVHPLLFIPIVFAMIGAINIYNFMDGINGITGLYSLTVLLTLLYINNNQIPFINSNLILLPIIALLVFNFFNVRKQAVCFAGDVGSISIAFICICFTTQLIVKTNDLVYSGLLLIYGLDGVSTICYRVVRREKLSEAHRSHFYQYLANERNWPHVAVSMLFVVAQLIFNIIVLFDHPPLLVYFNIVLFLFFALTALRIYLQGPDQLFGRAHK